MKRSVFNLRFVSRRTEIIFSLSKEAVVREKGRQELPLKVESSVVFNLLDTCFDALEK
jgi:hypothetical protein